MPNSANASVSSWLVAFGIFLLCGNGNSGVAQVPNEHDTGHVVSNIARLTDSKIAAKELVQTLTDSTSGEEELIFHEDPTVAIAAKWRQFLNSPRTLSKFENFTGYAEGRLGVNMPLEFKASLMDHEFRDGRKALRAFVKQHGAPASADNYGPIITGSYPGLQNCGTCDLLVKGAKKPRTIFLPDRHVKLANHGGKLQLGVNDEIVELSEDALTPLLDSVFDFPLLTAVFSKDRVAIALFSPGGYSFPIHVFERKTGRRIWQGGVLAAGKPQPGFSSGPSPHILVQLRMDRSKVVIFGISHSCRYCEILQMSDGVGVARFSSSLWCSREAVGVRDDGPVGVVNYSVDP